MSGYLMRRRLVVSAILAALLIALLVGWGLHRRRQYDVPATFATMSISAEDTRGWGAYHDDEFGFDVSYPPNYSLAPAIYSTHKSNLCHVSFRRGAASSGGRRTAGKGVSLHAYRLGQITGMGLGGRSIKVTRETTLADIAQQFMADDNRPLVRRTCHRRDINGNQTIVCTIRAPGEQPLLTGGIFQVFVLGVYEMGNGDRVLVQMSNNAGGTPYTGDRAIRRDVLRVFHTLRWTSGEAQ